MDERQVLSGARAGEFEGVADAALRTEAGGDHRLVGDFLVGSLTDNATQAAVEVLGILADADEVDMFAGLVLERRIDTRVELHGAEIDILIEVETEFQQDSFFDHAPGQSGIVGQPADGTEQDGIELLQLGHIRIVEDVP